MEGERRGGRQTLRTLNPDRSRAVILDTHVFVWFVNQPERIPPAVRDLIDEAGRVWVSLTALWEIVVKRSTRRPIISDDDLQGWFMEALKRTGHRLLAIRTRHVGAIQGLPLYHGDPFDRLLVAQATVEDVPIVTADSTLGRYDVEVIWTP